MSRRATSPAPTPPSYDGLFWLVVLACFLYGLAGSKPSLVASFRKELVGTFLIVVLTFTPGRWFGVGGEPVLGVPSDWIFHGAGIILTDILCGGPHVNPAMSFAFWLLGDIGFSAMTLNMVAQTLGSPPRRPAELHRLSFSRAAPSLQARPLACSAAMCSRKRRAGS